MDGEKERCSLIELASTPTKITSLFSCFDSVLGRRHVYFETSLIGCGLLPCADFFTPSTPLVFQGGVKTDYTSFYLNLYKDVS